MANRLVGETSPYLLQHKDNPVDWYPWGDEAFAAAADRDAPVLLSVGYSSCHWCHVMAHESFEDPETAAVMNDWFVCIKVDREERPDVDGIYMQAVQAMTGQGGWPMTVFLTPGGVPIFAGTYYPKEDRHGMPSFRRVLDAIHDAWSNRRDEVLDQAGGFMAAISQVITPVDTVAGAVELRVAYDQVVAAYDPVHGGFGRSPKFPQEPVLEFLLRSHGEPWAPEAMQILETTLQRMAAGGIHDQLGGGFARYATDREWVVPHFEKMLYTNAMLGRLYLRAGQVLGDPHLMAVAQSTIDYVLRDLALPDGGFMAAEDADSEGVEGAFYTWRAEQFQEATGDLDRSLTAIGAAAFGIRAAGNYEGTNVLTRTTSADALAHQLQMPLTTIESAIDQVAERLRAARSQRIRPEVDDKVITAWNGLMLRTLAEAGRVLDRSDYLAAAGRNASFLLNELRRPDGRLLRSWSKGRAELLGYLDDHGAAALGLWSLYEATGELQWYEAAAQLAEAIPALFMDDDGVLYATGSDAGRLIVRPQDQMDNPTPSGSSLAAEVFLRMGHYTGEGVWFDRFEQVVRSAGRLVERAPAAVGHLLAVVSSHTSGIREVALTGAQATELSAPIWSAYHPHLIVAMDESGAQATTIPLLAGRHRAGETLAYVCDRMVCSTPVEDVAGLARALG